MTHLKDKELFTYAMKLINDSCGDLNFLNDWEQFNAKFKQYPWVKDCNDLFLFLFDFLLSEIKNNFSDTSKISTKDKIFEIIMVGCDLLMPYKNAVKYLYQDCSTRYLIAKNHYRFFTPCQNFLKYYELVEDNVFAVAKAYAFMGFVIYILQIWIDDLSPDQSQTMAAIDQSIQNKYVQKLFDLNFFRL
jgi:hypothetical protein